MTSILRSTNNHVVGAYISLFSIFCYWAQVPSLEDRLHTWSVIISFYPLAQLHFLLLCLAQSCLSNTQDKSLIYSIFFLLCLPVFLQSIREQPSNLLIQ